MRFIIIYFAPISSALPPPVPLHLPLSRTGPSRPQYEVLQKAIEPFSIRSCKDKRQEPAMQRCITKVPPYHWRPSTAGLGHWLMRAFEHNSEYIYNLKLGRKTILPRTHLLSTVFLRRALLSSIGKGCFQIPPYTLVRCCSSCAFAVFVAVRRGDVLFGIANVRAVWYTTVVFESLGTRAGRQTGWLSVWLSGCLARIHHSAQRFALSLEENLDY